MEQLTFDPPEPKPGKLIFELTLPGRMPSWNEMLGMEHWARYKFKKELASNFLYALSRKERFSSTTTTVAKSSTLTFSATHLAAYLATAEKRRELRSVKKKLKTENQKKLDSKCTKSKKLPF